MDIFSALARKPVEKPPQRPAPSPSDTDTDGQRLDVQSKTLDRSGRPPVLYVNGVLTDMEKATGQAQSMANKLGRNVTLVHNATALPKEGRLRDKAAAAAKDSAEVVADQKGLGHNPAVDSLKEALQQRLDGDQHPIELVGFSQGAQISARALREVREERVQATMRRGSSRAQAEAAVDEELGKRVDFLNMSGAAQRSDFPAALQNYRQISIAGDPVSQLLGEQSGGYDRAEFPRRAVQLPKMILQNLPRHNFENVLKAQESQQTLIDFKL